MKRISILLFTLFAVFSVAFTLNSKEQDDDGDVKALMKELMKGVVAQVQEEEDQRSSAELESALSDLLSQIQEDDDDDDAQSQDDEDNDDVQRQDDGDGGREQEEGEDGDGLLALLQDDEEEEGGARRQDEDDNDVEMQDDGDGGDAAEQGWFSKIFRKVRRFGGRVRNVCNRVSRYSRALNCLPRMQAEMQRADDGDDDLAKDMLRRIANLQGEDDGDAEAQFFGKLLRGFRGIRKFWKRGRKMFKRVRRRFGGVVRGYRGIKRCVRRYG